MSNVVSPFTKYAAPADAAMGQAMTESDSIRDQAKKEADRITNSLKNSVEKAYKKTKQVADVVWTATRLKPLFGMLSKVPGIGRFAAGAGITGLGVLGGSKLMSSDADPVMQMMGLGDASDEHKNLALLSAAAAPILGAVAGSTSGTGALRGALTGIGALGGSYAGFAGSRAILNTLEDMEALDWMDKDWRSAAKILTTLGGTMAGGIAGAKAGESMTDLKNKPTE